MVASAEQAQALVVSGKGGMRGRKSERQWRANGMASTSMPPDCAEERTDHGAAEDG